MRSAALISRNARQLLVSGHRHDALQKRAECRLLTVGERLLLGSDGVGGGSINRIVRNRVGAIGTGRERQAGAKDARPLSKPQERLRASASRARHPSSLLYFGMHGSMQHEPALPSPLGAATTPIPGWQWGKSEFNGTTCLTDRPQRCGDVDPTSSSREV